jgi:hypothetical protein
VAYPVQEDRFSLIEATSALGRPAVVKMRERGKGPHLGRSQLLKIHSEAFFLDGWEGACSLGKRAFWNSLSQRSGRGDSVRTGGRL